MVSGSPPERTDAAAGEEGFQQAEVRALVRTSCGG